MEIERLQADMQILEPFIAENGAAVFFPDGYRNFKIDAGFHSSPYTVIQLGANCSEIRRFVYSIKERFCIKGFGNLRVDEIEILTSLSSSPALTVHMSISILSTSSKRIIQAAGGGITRFCLY